MRLLGFHALAVENANLVGIRVVEDVLSIPQRAWLFEPSRFVVADLRHGVLDVDELLGLERIVVLKHRSRNSAKPTGFGDIHGVGQVCFSGFSLGFYHACNGLLLEIV